MTIFTHLSSLTPNHALYPHQRFRIYINHNLSWNQQKKHGSSFGVCLYLTFSFYFFHKRHVRPHMEHGFSVREEGSIPFAPVKSRPRLFTFFKQLTLTSTLLFRSCSSFSVLSFLIPSFFIRSFSCWHLIHYASLVWTQTHNTLFHFLVARLWWDC